MIADSFTKPLQASHIKLIQDIVMGLKDFPPEEHVGENVFLTNNTGEKKVRTFVCLFVSAVYFVNGGPPSQLNAGITRVSPSKTRQQRPSERLG